jgi:putative zinc finger protein
MTHPGPLLIDYVDGTLSEDVRADVEGHLGGCATCREEVRLARTGKTAAGALRTPAAPAGVANEAIAEAGRIARKEHPEVAATTGASRRRPNAPRVAALATAAAVIIAIALLAPKLGERSENPAQVAAGTASSAAGAEVPANYPPATAVEVQHADYTSDQLANLTRKAQQSLRAAAAPEAGSGSTSFDVAFGNAAATALSTNRFGPATQCLQTAFGDPQGRLVRVILAKFNGQPAYFGVYLVSPGEGLPSNELRIDVASAHGCRILSQSSAKL